MLPPVPEDDIPVLRTTEPLLPLVAIPVFKYTAPVFPVFPTFADITVKAPLEVATPNPETREIEPPVLSPLSPAVNTIRPPAPLDPAPTSKLILPAAPLDAKPDLKATAPLLPTDVEPDLIFRDPLTPSTPASAVLTVNAPLDVEDPNPETIDTDPPVTVVLSPAETAIRPP
jgi:hypothetical protein